MVEMNVVTETKDATIKGHVPVKFEMNGTRKPEPTPAVFAIMLTEPRLCGGTRSSEIRKTRFYMPPRLLTTRQFAK